MTYGNVRKTSPGSSRAPARAASAKREAGGGDGLERLWRRLRPVILIGPRKRPILCGHAGDQLGERERLGREVELGLAAAARRVDLLHVRAAAGDGDRERPDLGDREVVVDRALHDHGLDGEQPGDQPAGRLRVVVGELDERAAEPRVLPLRAAGGMRPRGPARRGRRSPPLPLGRRRGRSDRGIGAAPRRPRRPRRRPRRPAPPAAGLHDGLFGGGASVTPLVTRSRSADAAASRSATMLPGVLLGRPRRRRPRPRPARGRGAGARARRPGPRRGGRARRRGRAGRPRARSRRRGRGAGRARAGRPRGRRARR